MKNSLEPKLQIYFLLDFLREIKRFSKITVVNSNPSVFYTPEESYSKLIDRKLDVLV